jgi:alkylhydroperoxidase/carboxymuconolactone decarboxylase family protein YurZ
VGARAASVVADPNVDRTTLGGVEPQLEVHVNAGLNVGLTAREVVEAMLQCRTGTQATAAQPVY